MAEAIFCQLLYKRRWNLDGNKSLRGWVGMELKFCGDGCNFCPRAGLYSRWRLGLIRTSQFLFGWHC